MQPENAAAFRLSPQQAAIWATRPEGRAQGVVRLDGPIDPAALEQAMVRLVDRHEILRTAFVRRPGLRMPLQVVMDQASPSWRAVDLLELAREEQEARLSALAEEERRRPIDLEQGPPFHSLLVLLAEDRAALIVTLSALCADGGSLDAFARELASVYEPQGAEPATEEPLQYVDFGEWQHDAKEAAGETAGEELEVQALRLPFAREGIGAADARADRARVALPGGALQAAEGIAESCSLPVESVLLAAWGAVLARVSAVDDVAIGVVSRDRANPQLATMIGPQAMILPAPVGVGDEVPFRALATVVANRLEGSDRATAHPAGAQMPRAGFEWRAWTDPLTAGGLAFAVDRVDVSGEPFQIALVADRFAEGLDAELVYDSAALDAATVARLAESFATLLESAGSAPEAPAALLEIVPTREREALARGSASGPTDLGTATITELFHEQAERTPDRPALASGDERLTYRELRARTDTLAHHLRTRGVEPGVRVGVLMDRSMDAVVAMLGVLVAGGAYVPLAPDNPAARVQAQIEDSAPLLVLTHGNHADLVPAGLALTLDGDLDLRSGDLPSVEQLHDLDSDCYVIYTSGSTGRPKGVQNTHRGLANYSRALAAKLTADDGERGLDFALVSNITADLGNTAIYPALASGGCVHVMPEAATMDGQVYGAYCSGNPIDVLKVAPSQLAALLTTGEEALVLPRRWLLLGGEALPIDLARRLEAAGGCQVINHYGPTETTIGSLVFPVAELPSLSWQPSTVPIGRPIDNTAAFVLDAHGRLVPVGVPGELCIAGAGLARGYVNRPDEDEKRFVRNELAAGWGGVVYRTGDLARVGPDGYFEHLGRIDHQVKIRGYRVEPGEIEALLRSHPGVRQAAVTAREDTPGDVRLVAYLVPEPGRAPGVDAFREFLRAQLPEYMIPSAFVPLEALPLTRSGKLDARALPAPAAAGSRHQAAFVAPSGSDEEVLAAIWAEILGVDRVSATDDFFELGGHSLLATRVIARIRRTLEVEVPLQALWESPTVAGLAAAVAESRAAAPEAAEDDEELAEMLAELEGLSDEEAERLLALEQAPPADG